MDEPKNSNPTDEPAADSQAAGTTPVMGDVKPPEPKPVPEVPEVVKETMTTATETETVATPPVSEPPAAMDETLSKDSMGTPSPILPGSNSQPRTVKQHSPSMIRVVLAVALGLILIAVAVYFYLSSNPVSEDAATVQENSTVQTTPTTPATTSDVDQTISEVDDALTAADAAQDVSTEDLSDTALGL